MRAIQTKWLGPTDTKPSRFVATVKGARVEWARQWELSTDANHWEAAQALLIKLGWVGEYVGATLVDGVMVWVPVDGVKLGVR